MGGRDLPVECPHGFVVDWGGYGGLPQHCVHCDQESGANLVQVDLQALNEQLQRRIERLQVQVDVIGKAHRGYVREALERLAEAAEVDIENEHGERKRNFQLVDDIEAAIGVFAEKAYCYDSIST